MEIKSSHCLPLQNSDVEVSHLFYEEVADVKTQGDSSQSRCVKIIYHVSSDAMER